MALYPPLWMQEGTYPANLDRFFIQDALGPGPALLSGSGALQVTQRAAGTNMSVDVAAGRALIPGTDIANQGAYTIWSDTVVNVPIAVAPGVGTARIDLIVAQVRDDFVIGGGRSDFVIVPIQGTAAVTGSQVAPAVPSSTLVLAQILVGSNVPAILNSFITDVRPYARAANTQLLVSRPLASLITAGSPYTVNHNLNTTSLIVDIWDTVTNQRIMANVAIVDANNISVSVTQNAPNPVNVVIMGTSVAPTMVLPSNLATVQYVQQQLTQAYNFAFMQTIASPTAAGSPYSIAHNLNTTNVFVEIWDAVTNQLVMTQINIVDVNHISITVAQNMPNSINVVVMGVGNAPLPLNPSNTATKQYVDSKTPTLPAAVTTGATIQSFTDSLGDVWVALNGVNGGNWRRARDVLHSAVYRNAAWTTSNANTPIAFDTVIKDDYGLWVSPSWTAPVAGWYDIYGQYEATPAAAGNLFNIFIGAGVSAYQSTFARAVETTAARTHASLYLAAGGQGQVVLQTTAAYTGSTGNQSTCGRFHYMGSG
jgi:hypothetical protein